MASNQHSSADCATKLVVESESAFRALFSRLLADADKACSQAGSADEAKTSLAPRYVPLVTLDVSLPDQPGIELHPQIVTRSRDTQLLMAAVDEQCQSANKALSPGAEAHMIKPVDPERLRLRIALAFEGRQLPVESCRDTLRDDDEIRWADEEAIHGLVAAAARHDMETDAHLRRTELLTEALALVAGWSPADASRLGMAARMHDIGKIGISDSILQKRSTLTFDEFEILKQHTTIGARMLAHSASPLMQLAKRIALSHHERWDGTGYPQRLTGDAIPEAARFLTVVDVYDLLSHDHMHRPALAEDAVLATMRQGQGTQFDPGLAGLFLAHYEEMHRIAESHPDARSEE